MIARARADFKHIEMKPNEKASTFVDRFKTSRLKADHKDNSEMAERLVDGLNDVYTGLLLNDPDYKILRKKEKYTSEQVAQLLRGIQLDQDQIERKKQQRSKHKSLEQYKKPELKEPKDQPKQSPQAKVALTQAYNAQRQSSNDFEYRMRTGICHL